MILQDVFVYAGISIFVAIICLMSNLKLSQIVTLSFQEVWVKLKSLPHLAKIVLIVWLLSKIIMLAIVGVTVSLLPLSFVMLESMTVTIAGMEINTVSALLAIVGGYVGDGVLRSLSKRFGFDLAESKQISEARLEDRENSKIDDKDDKDDGEN